MNRVQIPCFFSEATASTNSPTPLSQSIREATLTMRVPRGSLFALYSFISTPEPWISRTCRWSIPTISVRTLLSLAFYKMNRPLLSLNIKRNSNTATVEVSPIKIEIPNAIDSGIPIAPNVKIAVISRVPQPFTEIGRPATKQMIAAAAVSFKTSISGAKLNPAITKTLIIKPCASSVIRVTSKP